MISNVAVQTADAASAAPAAGESGETGDTGAFDALLALQSGAYANAAGTVNAQVGDLQEDSSEDTDVDAESPDGALWFFSALLPAPKVSPPAVAAGSGNIPQADADAVAQASRSTTMIDLAPASVPDASAGKDADPPVIALKHPAASPVVDTTAWNSLTGPAELFAQGARPAAERVESAPLTTHVRDPRWVDEIGNRLASMVRTGDSSASLQLTPADLGPLEIKVAVRDNQATVHFGATNAETRALLEASMPRLREMLESQGFQLMDSSVSHGFARQTRHEAAGTSRVDDIADAPSILAQTKHVIGLLDLYA